MHQLPPSKHWIYLHVPTNLQQQKNISWKLSSFLGSLYLDVKI